MSANIFTSPLSSTPVVEIPPVDLNLTSDWGEAGPPPPRAPRLTRQNAMIASYYVEIDSTHHDDVSRELFPAARAVQITEHVTGAHFDHPLMNRVHFNPTFWDELYDTRYKFSRQPESIDMLVKSFKSILCYSANRIYVVPFTMPSGITWLFQTFVGRAYEDVGAILIDDLGISEELALTYMACDYIRQSFVNPKYLRPDRTGTPAAIAEINTVLTRQCELHMELCGFIIK